MEIRKITKKMNVDIYTTSDGMEFTLPSQAEYHERHIQDARIYRELHSMELEIPLFGEILDGKWYMVSNDEQIEYFTRKYTQPKNYVYVNHSNVEKLSLGDWVAIEYEHTEDGKESSGLVTLSYVIGRMKDFIERAEKVTVDGKY